MELCLKVLEREKQVTQRELFYRLLCESPEYFTSQSQVNRAIQGRKNLFAFKKYFSSNSKMSSFNNNFVFQFS